MDFTRLYQEHFQDVYRFLLSLSRDEAIAEEMTQETFCKAFQHIDGFRGQCKLKVWLCQIAKNTYFSYTQKEKRRRSFSLLEQQTAVENVEEYVLQAESLLTLHQALHLLNEPYKEVFTLRVFGELPFSQISGLFGKTESWARGTFYRAKQKIQQRLEEVSSYDKTTL